MSQNDTRGRAAGPGSPSWQGRPAGHTTGSTATGTRSNGTTSRAPRGTSAPRALTGSGALDALALVVMLGAAIVGFGPAWGSTAYLLPAVGGMVLGLGVAWLGAWRRWGTLSVAAAAVLVYVLLGGPFALPGTTVAGVLPTLDTFRGLLLGAVTGWKEIVTSVPPLQSFPELGVVPFLLLFVTSLVAGTLAWRVRDAQWALVPVALAFVAIILLGTVVPAVPVVQGLVLVVVGLLWGAWRATEARLGEHQVTTEASLAATRRLRWHRARGGAAMLALGGVAAVLLAPVLTPDTERMVLRENVVPPLDLHEYVSPLASFRKYAKEMTEDELFTVEGLPAGARVRLATLDAYNGVVYDVSSGGAGSGSGVFTRAGDQIATVAQGTPTDLTVTIGDYRGVWVPDVGSLAGIVYQGERAEDLGSTTYYNSTTATGVVTAGLRPGDSFRLDAIVAPAPSAEDLQSTRILDEKLPRSINVPDSVAGKAAQFMAEETDPVVQLDNLKNGLVASGIFSSGLETQLPSRPGHSAERIDTLLADEEMIGDDEQFAVALALMAQSAGIPARVVMGFYPPETWEEGTPFVATGADVHAWVEVPFEGYGWVPVDAIPEEDNKIEPEPKSDQVPKPPVLEDPEPPEEPADAEAGTVDDEEKKDDAESSGFDWGQAALVAVAVAVPLILLALPLLLIVAFKSRRRKRRREAERPVDRISGGWREVLDAATDLGAPVAGGATRREGAGALSESFPAAAAPTVTLARTADAQVFGTGDPSPQEIESFWTEVDAVLTGMRSTLPRRQRLRAAVSLRSLRGARRSWLPARFRRARQSVRSARTPAAGPVTKPGDK
ncbi:transglutaminase [Oerskovia sp. Root918]|uniref:transglutaminase-like domain-containing protein n=1 Tax=Oerskovia sp. Root918 TaxID=1736607 RepID=UPI0006F31E7E|nr:transglutaminase domain-containing protein [Oerskovia sp. Root918]KRD37364.1 transglutaminase [Oerskovia sp. Root918]